MNIRVFATCVATCAFVFLSAVVLHGQEGMQYREFQLGSDVASVARMTGDAASAAKVVHLRPSVLKDLEWRPQYAVKRPASTQVDPVAVVVFSFVDDRLFKVSVDYDRHRTEGMTGTDLIEALTATYGPTSPLPKPSRVPTTQYGGPDTPLAFWADAESSVTLLRVAYPASFRLIVSSTQLERLAQTAIAEAVRLDASEAPQREIARQQKEADDARVARERARGENKAAFRP